MKKNIWLVVGVVIIIAVIIIGVRLTQKSVPLHEQTIKIGAILPLTGELAEFGVDEQRGMRLAVEAINNEGGIGGKKLSIMYEDSKSDPKTAVNALQKLIATDKPPVVFSLGSSISLAIAPMVDQNKIVLIAVAVYPLGEPRLAPRGQMIYI
ncbi:MAG: ABC transporter substrate-binding protein [Candidatus Nitrosotenuis sp.]